MHIIQKEILKRLVYKNCQKFAGLSRGYSAEENIVFHLKQLIKAGLIAKSNTDYILTKAGLFTSGQFDIDSLEDQKFKTVYIGFVCCLNNKYLLRERIQDNQQFYKFPGGKPLLGEPMSNARDRLFYREVGIHLRDEEFSYLGTHFKIQKTTHNEVLFDDTLVLYKVGISPNKSLTLRDGNKWFSVDKIATLFGKWPEIDIVVNEKNKNKIYEYEFTNDYNLLSSFVPGS